MSVCVASSPMNTATKQAEEFRSLSHHQSSTRMKHHLEIESLRNSIFAFESRDSSSNDSASSVSATATTSKRSRRHSRRARLGKRFSTTSTVLAESTITNPNFSQVNYWYVDNVLIKCLIWS